MGQYPLSYSQLFSTLCYHVMNLYDRSIQIYAPFKNSAPPNNSVPPKLRSCLRGWVSSFFLFLSYESMCLVLFLVLLKHDLASSLTKSNAVHCLLYPTNCHLCQLSLFPLPEDQVHPFSLSLHRAFEFALY